PVVVSTTRMSTAMYASLFLPPTEIPPKLRPPPPPDVFSSYAETVPITRYFAPVSFPTFAALLLLTRPDEARSCSSSTGPSFARSTMRNFSVADSSLLSIPARSCPAPPYHHAADVSFLKSATPIDGLSAAVSTPAQSNTATATKHFFMGVSSLNEWPRLYPQAMPRLRRPCEHASAELTS